MYQYPCSNSLPEGGQLFLETIRRLTSGQLHDPTMLDSMRTLFESHAMPEGLPVIQGTLSAVICSAMRSPVFNQVGAADVLIDERSLINCLASMQDRPTECACVHLASFIERPGLEIVMPFMLGTARLFNARRLRFAPERPVRRSPPNLRSVN